MYIKGDPMDETGKRLEQETRKWLAKIEKSAGKMEVSGEADMDKAGPVIENIRAYISDCRHFLEKGELVNAFEAVIYAWAILETCQHLGVINK